MDIKVYQVFHKSYPVLNESNWMCPIGVSGYIPGNMMSDANGQNIAALNKYYCELTVIYYIWKNRRRSDYIGLSHYRRFLNFKIDNSFHDIFALSEKVISPEIIDYLTDNTQYNLLEKIMNITDVVIPRRSLLLPNIKVQYLTCMESSPWLAFEAAIQKKYGVDEKYLNFFEISPLAPICNMFVMKWDVFISYCEDLFEIINHVYETIGAPYDEYNNRYPGFLAERYLGFWLHFNNVSYLEVPVITFK